jgi:hypothetical protein
MYQNSMNDSSRHAIHDLPFQNYNKPLNFSHIMQSKLGGQQPHPQWRHVPCIPHKATLSIRLVISIECIAISIHDDWVL